MSDDALLDALVTLPLFREPEFSTFPVFVPQPVTTATASSVETTVLNKCLTLINILSGLYYILLTAD